MHKLSIGLFLLFLTSPLFAERTYSIREVELRYDETKGTFEKDGTDTRGAVVGFSFTVDAKDDVTGALCSDGGVAEYTIPILKIPSKAEIIPEIQKVAEDSGLIKRLDGCLDTVKKLSDIRKITEEDKIQDLDGTLLAKPQSIGK